MKIIGHTEQNGYLVQMSTQEIFMLVGEQYLSYRKKEELNEDQQAFLKKVNDKAIIGAEIPLHDMYKIARRVIERWNEDKSFLDTIRYMRGMADELEQIGKVYS